MLPGPPSQIPVSRDTLLRPIFWCIRLSFQKATHNVHSLWLSPSSSRTQTKTGECYFICATFHFIWLSAVSWSLLPSNGLGILKVLTRCAINHPGGNWSWWGPEDGTSLKWSQLSQDLNVVIINQAQQWKNNWGQNKPTWGEEKGVKQLFLSRDVPNTHQKFTQGMHGCLVKDFISLEEKTQKNNRIANFLGGESV